MRIKLINYFKLNVEIYKFKILINVDYMICLSLKYREIVVIENFNLLM